MKKYIITIIIIFISLFSSNFITTPAFAECPENCVPTSILGDTTGNNGEKCACDSTKDGSGIRDLLRLIVEVMTVGVGLIGMLGIIIVGIQYLTAGDNEEKARKAKRRMFEIVIGLVAYVMAYAFLQWLAPDFKPFGS